MKLKFNYGRGNVLDFLCGFGVQWSNKEIKKKKNEFYFEE